MKAIRVNEHGGPEVLSYEDVPVPEPGPGEARVRLAAAGVNFIDVYQRTGLYPKELPFTLGLEGAGEVDAVGEGVEELSTGDYVAFASVPGAYAEYVVAPVDKLVPFNVTLVETRLAAAVMLQGMTAHYLTHSTFPLQEGQTALVHAAAGGVGLLLVQMAKMRGATVIGTAGSEEKGRLAKGAGADEVIVYTEQDFVEETKRITGGEGVHVAYDSVGKSTFDGSLDCLRPRGYMVLFGASSGPVPPFDLQILNQKGGLFVTRPALAHYTATREELLWRAESILSWVGNNSLDVRIGGTYSLSDAEGAHRDLEGRKTTGKLILIPQVKLDASLGVEGKNLRSAGDAARAADALGFDGLWTSETRHDAFLPLAIAADATGRIELGTSIAVAFSRSLMVVAQTAWDLQDLSGGRFTLGLGTQVKAHIKRRFSMPWERPVARLREYLGALRAIWDSFQTGEPLSFEGEFYRHTLMTPFFNPGPIEYPEIPVYIAGVNTALATLAGELCDGFHVHPFHSTQYVRRTVKPAIAEGAKQEGRHPAEIELSTSVFVVTREKKAEIEEQREKMRAQIAFYTSTPTYRTVLEAHGWEEVGERLGKLARDKNWEEMPELITDEMLRAFAVEAAPDEVGPALRGRYEGLTDRLNLYTPFVPGEKDGFWRAAVESMHASP